MPERLSFKEVLARRDGIPGALPSPSGSPVKLIPSAGVMDGPVGVALVIRSPGHSLKEAHDTIDRLAAGQRVPIEPVRPDGRAVLAESAELNVRAQVVDHVDVDVRTIRRRLALTQAEFAARFGLELDTVRSWEQGRHRPDPTARVLLAVIEQNPEAVDAALALS